ncbi:MAG: hypothetical protein NTY30_00135, partial [Candidatus Berkelbacteria bacterium]|nr:hypothetical protein [Candidatus Berkelbacteria bacterium]
MYKDKPFPYPLSLTQLEGFDPTVAESKVAASPAVQLLRQHGLPTYGTIATAMTHDPERKWRSKDESEFELTETRMTPTEVDHYCQEWNDHMRKASHLAAQVRREILGGGNTDERDLRLLHDLCVWLNYKPLKQFRWEEYWNTLEERIENADWYRQVAEFQASGHSDLIVLLTSSLAVQIRKTLRDQVVNGVAKLKGLHNDHSSYYAPFLPRIQSIWDPHNGGEVIDDTSLAVIDCGDIAKVKSWIPDRRLQRQITSVRFELPRSCFVGSLHWSVMSAPMLIFDIEALEDGSRALTLGRLKIWLEERQVKPELRTNAKSSDQDWQATQVLVPANDAQL